jgi:putative MATE family efflux protein
MDSDRSNKLGQDGIPTLLLQFSAPAIVGAVAQALYNVIDTIFVGRAIGIDGIAATTVALPPMVIILAFGMLVGFGAAALISIRLGERKKDEAERILGNATTMLIAVALMITGVGLVFLDDILVLFGASQNILPLARDYLRIILWGTIFQTILFGLNASIRGEGNPRIAMLSMLISVLLNVIFAPIFIFWFGWGMQGAAWATVVSQAVSAVWVVAYFLCGTSVLKFHLRNLWPDLCVCTGILAVGSPAFAVTLANGVLHSILNRQLGDYGGDLAISVWGIIFRTLMMVFMPMVGLNQGAQPIIGYNFGAQRFDRVKKTLETAIMAATGFAVLGFVAAMCFPGPLIRLFAHNDEEPMALGIHAIRIAALMLPVVGAQIIGAGYFQAVGKARQAMILMLSRQVILLIPAAIILPKFFGLDGVWAALPTADFGAFVWTSVWLLLELRHLRDRHLASAASQ